MFARKDLYTVHDASAALQDRGLAPILATYIRLANGRQTQDLIDLYTPAPTLLMNGTPLRGDLPSNMQRAVKAWTLLAARFGPVRVLEEQLDAPAPEVTFLIPSRGTFVIVPQRFDFVKRLQFQENGEGWLISLDETVNAGIAGKALQALGLA